MTTRVLLVSALLLAGCVKQPAPWKPGGGEADAMDASGSDSQVLADGRGGTDVAPADGAGDPETGRADACVPYCEEWWECGNDGCGGKCGDGCQAGETCFEFGCVEE